jgi:glycine cleavage system aminomethyltransferase T
VHAGTNAGHTLTSVYSTALRRAIALARVDIAFTAPDTELSLALPFSLDRLVPSTSAARVVTTPFVRSHPGG